MNDIATYPYVAEQHSNLPDTIEELSKFVLVGREKLIAVRAEIRAIDKLKLANNVKEQKLQEAQNIAEVVLDVEVRLGELFKQLPKALNQYTNAVINADNCKNKRETLEELGYSQLQANRFETLANSKALVEQAKTEAREQGNIVTRQAVFDLAEEVKKPHIMNNSGNNEWYTPKEYIEAAREVMGDIDYDPATSDMANKIVGAKRYDTIESNGLMSAWHGRVWLNPPYAADLVSQFIGKLKAEVISKRVTEAIVLVNNATETIWFNMLIEIATAFIFPNTRVKFYLPDGKTGTPLQGQAIIYIGANSELFMNVFKRFGWGAYLDRS